VGEKCFVCGSTDPDVRPAFFRVVGATYLGVAAFVRWVNFRGPCCENCFVRGTAITRARSRAVNVWVIAPIGIILIAYLVLVLIFRSEQAFIGVIMLTGLVWMLGFLALPVYLSWLSRARIPAFLGPQRDEQLRQLSGLRSWAAGKHLVMLREIPAKEQSVDLPV
jgi:hypothetical protein